MQAGVPYQAGFGREWNPALRGAGDGPAMQAGVPYQAGFGREWNPALQVAGRETRRTGGGYGNPPYNEGAAHLAVRRTHSIGYQYPVAVQFAPSMKV
jgi:hypothetical protein